MAELVFVPSKARRIILAWLSNKRLRDPAAMLLMALSERVEQSFDDAALARIAGIEVGELPALIERLAEARWLLRTSGPDGVSYVLRNDGPLKPAWIRSSHMEPDDQS